MTPQPPSLPNRSSVFSDARFGLLLWIALVLLVLVARAPYYTSATLEHGDAALNAIQIHHAKDFSEIHGNYSRFRFHHPGPAFFYVYAAAEVVLCDWLGTGLSPVNAHKLAGLVVQAGFFALGLTLLRDLVRRPLFVPLLLVAAAMHFSLVDFVLWSIWPPHVLLMPFFALGAACLAIACGRIDRLPWAVLAGSFLVHGHVAQPLFVGTLATLAYVAAWRTHGAPWRGHLRPHVIGALIFLVAVVPFVLDAIRGAESNFAEIIRHLREGSGNPKKLLKVLLYVVSYFGYVRDQDVVLRELSWSSTSMFPAHWRAFGTWALLVGASGAAWWRLRSGSDGRMWNRFALGLLATVALCAYWARSQTGGMFEFNMYFFHAVSFASLLPLLAWIADFLSARLSLRAVASGLILIAGSAAFFGFHRGPLNDYEAGLQRLEAVRSALAQSTEPSRAKFVAFDDETWDSAASVALALQRAGVPYAVDRQWGFMLPRQIAPLSHMTTAPLPYEVWRVLPERGETGELILGNGHALVTTPAVLQLPATLTFTPDGNGRRYLVAGLSHLEPHGPFTWLARSDAVLEFIPGETNRDVELRTGLVPWGPHRPPLEIYFNGELLWRGTLSAPQELRLRVPVRLWRARSVATLRLHQEGARNPYELGRPLDWVGPSVSFRNLQFVAAEP